MAEYLQQEKMTDLLRQNSSQRKKKKGEIRIYDDCI